MKKLFVIVFVSISFHLFGQTDTIYKTNGDVLLADINEITEDVVKFIYPNESFSNSVNHSSIIKIHFKSGRKQEFLPALNLVETKSCLDWESVQISGIESDVKDLFKIDNVGAKAKGLSTLSSIAKLQDRAYNKLKMEAAMLGGNAVFIIDQNTTEAIYGGEYASSQLPSVSLSGIAYTSNKTTSTDISFGDYSLLFARQLKANSYAIEELYVKPHRFTFDNSMLKIENGFQKILLKSSTVKKVSEFKIIYADNSQLILSAVYSSKHGKKTYYNLFFERI